jgi:hypothetical protein
MDLADLKDLKFGINDTVVIRVEDGTHWYWGWYSY